MAAGNDPRSELTCQGLLAPSVSPTQACGSSITFRPMVESRQWLATGLREPGAYERRFQPFAIRFELDEPRDSAIPPNRASIPALHRRPLRSTPIPDSYELRIDAFPEQVGGTAEDEDSTPCRSLRHSR